MRDQNPTLCCKYDMWLADESLSCYTVICTIMITSTDYDFEI